MNRRIALISDIHSNLLALEAVLADIDQQSVDAIYCLGDVVGYGPQPSETLAKVIAVTTAGKAILGNHDYAVLSEPIGFNRSARDAVEWTREVLSPRWFQFGARRQHWQWLKGLPTSFAEDDVLFVHASPRQHLEEYILEEHTQGMSIAGEDPEIMLEENFQLLSRLCFVGHTHRPGVLTESYRWFKPCDIDYRWELESRQRIDSDQDTATEEPQKLIINIGSVGQPRDGDPRSCYAIFDGSSVEWRRVSYDTQAACRLIETQARLDNRLGERLLAGK